MIYKRLRHSALKSRMKPRKWSKILLNEPCFILGNGPSILNHNVNLLNDRYFSLGINSSYQLLDSTMLLWQDIEFFYSSRKILPSLKSILFSRDTSDPLNIAMHFTLQTGGFKLPRNPSILHGMGATGPLAFQTAYVLGCNPIILLGFDCMYKDGMTDFYGVNRFHKPHTLKTCKRGLKWIKNCQFERKIINCSENLVFGEPRTLENVLKEFDDKYPHRTRKYFIDKMINSVK